jgi:hypothetical protein
MDAAISERAVQPTRSFCAQESICLATFYNLRKRSLQEGRGDPIRKLGRKSMVFPELARAWLRSMTTTAA